jgi:polyferredoxin
VKLKIPKDHLSKNSSMPIIHPKPLKASSFRIGPYRRAVQFGFAAVCLWIGIDFTRFVHQLEAGLLPTVNRPPGVEAFLPISALISFKYWLLTGVFNRIHPAALVVLLLAVATGLLLKKGFCSWVCPVGLLSEYLAKLLLWLNGFRLRNPRVETLGYKRSSLQDAIHPARPERTVKNSPAFQGWAPPRWLDYPLRGVKYLLLAFFLGAVFGMMDVTTLERFINSPYNKVADIKMWAFFAHATSLTVWVLGILVGLSVVVPYFWCRYLCPYGALLGLTSLTSLFKIQRNADTCIACGKCAKVCPARLAVDKLPRVRSDECHACLQCVDACPVKDTLYLGVTQKKAKLPRLAYAIIIVGLFLAGTGLARWAGVWQNQISNPEYLHRIKHLDEPVYQHNRGQVPDYTQDTGN